MGELIIGLYTNNIRFIYKEDTLAVGKEWNEGATFNSVDYNKIINGKWVVTHFYYGYKELKEFNSAREVIEFFKKHEQKSHDYETEANIKEVSSL